MSAWVERMRDITIPAIADELNITAQGYAQTPSGWTLGPCPACQAERRHAGRGDKRGALGVAKSNLHGWHCFSCEASGDAIDLIAYSIGGARLRDLDADHKAAVREWCSSYLGLDANPRRIMPKPVAAERPITSPSGQYLDPAEVDAFWRRCTPVAEDAKAAAWLRDERGIDPELVGALDLARVAPADDLPRWAGYGGKDGRPWSSWPSAGLSMVVRLFDVEGRARSMLFRRTAEGALDFPPKSVSASGVSRAGLVMANGLGHHLLSFGINSANGLDVIIAEGEMDFITSSILYAPDDEERACFGIVQGSWTPAIAGRVPRGAKVTVLSHDDDPGQRYVAQIAGTLKGRCMVQNRVCR